MELRDVGEFGLIERIARATRRLGTSPDVRIGIGDDAAVLRPRRGEEVVLTTDALFEGVHFDFDSESPRTAGRRALVANLSDLAAMGARPLGFTLALAAPPRLPVRTVDGLVAGLLHEARVHQCPLVGGNVSRARETSLTISVLGAVARGRALTRSGARAGDRILVTGSFGGAALERARATRGRGRVRGVPTPRLQAGRALARVRQVGGCIDVSDGLLADLAHLLEGRALHAEIEVEKVPRPARMAGACKRLGLAAERLVLCGGEDYELLFTLRPAGPSCAALSRRLGVVVTEVGRVCRGRRREPVRTAVNGGWKHF